MKTTKAVPPPPKVRSCRPTEPPPERSHHSPPNYFEMGGLQLGPRVRDCAREPVHNPNAEGRCYSTPVEFGNPGSYRSYEQRIQDWELSQRYVWQEDQNYHSYLDEFSDELLCATGILFFLSTVHCMLTKNLKLSLQVCYEVAIQ